jgi:cytochrome c5
MTPRLTAVAVLAGVAFLVPLRASAHRGDAAAPARPMFSQTVWDSVYTAEQATRGDSLYKLPCVKCHG